MAVGGPTAQTTPLHLTTPRVGVAPSAPLPAPPTNSRKCSTQPNRHPPTTRQDPCSNFLYAVKPTTGLLLRVVCRGSTAGLRPQSLMKWYIRYESLPPCSWRYVSVPGKPANRRPKDCRNLGT